MGGSVVVGIRKRDGSVLAQVRDTNAMKHWFHDPKFLAGDEATVGAYVARAEGGSGSRCPLAPAGYGLVVVDFQSDRILSMQDYTTFGRIDPATMFSEANTADPETAGHVEKQLRDGRLGTGDVLYRRPGQPMQDIVYLERDMGAAAVRKLARTMLDTEDAEWTEQSRRMDAGDDTLTVKRFVYDLSPMELENFADAAVMRRRLCELGFTFDAVEPAAWDACEAWQCRSRP